MEEPPPIGTPSPYYVVARTAYAWMICARWRMSEVAGKPMAFVEIARFDDATHGGTEGAYASAVTYWERLTEPGGTPKYC